jgi:hypothetical protein
MIARSHLEPFNSVLSLLYVVTNAASLSDITLSQNTYQDVQTLSQSDAFISRLSQQG